MSATSHFDDKTPHVLPFILSHLQDHTSTSPTTPFIIGLNGVQGAGKTVLVSSLRNTLSSPPHNLPTIVFSLDDFYLPHCAQQALAASNPDNPLLQHRGQPGTHDTTLLAQVFTSLTQNLPTKIPQYNKALFNGQGDRLPESEWETVNTDPSNPVRIIIFEGWSVGFQPLTPSSLAEKHTSAIQQNDAAEIGGPPYHGRLAYNTLASITTINIYLATYAKLWEFFNVFIHIDAYEPLYVYKWRLEQEATTRRERGNGMSEEQVKRFVDGYYPSYELYTDVLRDGVFRPRPESRSGDGDGEEKKKGEEGGKDSHGEWKGRQLRLVVGEDRKVRDVIRI